MLTAEIRGIDDINKLLDKIAPREAFNIMRATNHGDRGTALRCWLTGANRPNLAIMPPDPLPISRIMVMSVLDCCSILSAVRLMYQRIKRLNMCLCPLRGEEREDRQDHRRQNDAGGVGHELVKGANPCQPFPHMKQSMA